MTAPKRDWKAHSLNGVFLRFIVHDGRRLHGLVLHDWLLKKAQALGIHGGCAFHGIAGFGRHGVLHEHIAASQPRAVDVEQVRKAQASSLSSELRGLRRRARLVCASRRRLWRWRRH